VANKKNSKSNIDRRTFLRDMAVVGTASGLLTKAHAAPAQKTETSSTVSATVPSNKIETMEREQPLAYTSAEASRYFVNQPGSDFMVDTIKSLNIDYLASNPGSSFRGLHESIVNYGGNNKPEFLTCLHEESSVAMGHGYAKAAGKPLAVACHGTVGLQHASMAIYNAWCDRAPVIVLAGNHLDAAERKPPVEWAHSVQDAASIVRDFSKWDDTPASLQHFAESMVRAYKIATTPPMGPVVLVLDAGLQEHTMGNASPKIPAMSPTIPPQGEAGAIEEAAGWLLEAEHPLIFADRVARTPSGMKYLVELAEALQAPVVDKLGRMNFPNDHYLNQFGQVRSLIRQADVILGLEMTDFWGSVNSIRDIAIRDERRKADPAARLVSIGVGDLYQKSNYQDFQRYQPVDLSIAGDAEATLPSLIEAVKRLTKNHHRTQMRNRQKLLRASYKTMQTQAQQAASYAWNASPISTARLCMEIWQKIKNLDWSLVSQPFFQSFWPQRLWVMNQHHQFNGSSGGFGIGYGAPAAVGAALAQREHGRIPINIQPDGDLLYSPGVFWTAAHHDIPLLSIMHNNRGYHQEVMHVQRMALQRQRGIDGQAKTGNTFEDPDIDFATMAKSMGLWSSGPISEPNDLATAIARALDVVKQGEPALVDVICQPR
jgi:acetolactate synthase I/II/III large subunit